MIEVWLRMAVWDPSHPRPATHDLRSMKHSVIRVGRIVFGIVFLILGVLGLFLPVLQGVLFLMIGLSLLSKESDHARRLLEWMKRSRWAPERWRIDAGSDSGELH